MIWLDRQLLQILSYFDFCCCWSLFDLICDLFKYQLTDNRRSPKSVHQSTGVLTIKTSIQMLYHIWGLGRLGRGGRQGAYIHSLSRSVCVSVSLFVSVSQSICYTLSVLSSASFFPPVDYSAVSHHSGSSNEEQVISPHVRYMCCMDKWLVELQLDLTLLIGDWLKRELSGVHNT